VYTVYNDQKLVTLCELFAVDDPTKVLSSPWVHTLQRWAYLWRHLAVSGRLVPKQICEISSSSGKHVAYLNPAQKGSNLCVVAVCLFIVFCAPPPDDFLGVGQTVKIRCESSQALSGEV